MQEYAGGRVKIIAHRVSLCEYLYSLLKDQGFLLYSLVEDWENVKKLIICIDSLWKVPPAIKFDLVWIDEVHEMIGSLCSLKVKAPGSGKWTFSSRCSERSWPPSGSSSRVRKPTSL